MCGNNFRKRCICTFYYCRNCNVILAPSTPRRLAPDGLMLELRQNP
jgi:hypothetical protein